MSQTKTATETVFQAVNGTFYVKDEAGKCRFIKASAAQKKAAIKNEAAPAPTGPVSDGKKAYVNFLNGLTTDTKIGKHTQKALDPKVITLLDDAVRSGSCRPYGVLRATSKRARELYRGKKS